MIVPFHGLLDEIDACRLQTCDCVTRRQLIPSLVGIDTYARAIAKRFFYCSNAVCIEARFTSSDLDFKQAMASHLVAERLRMAQPPLSRQIAALEAQLRVLLLRRIRPLELTDAGRFLFEQARQVLSRMEEIEAGARRIGTGYRRFFGIGFVGSTLYGPP
jgi:Bacterial regulatory helix-turn-helix protein, lysR family